MFENSTVYIGRVIAAIDTVSIARRTVLDEAAEFIRTKLEHGKVANLTFICTHNSRRSHFGQVWCQVAAHHFGLQSVHAFSGGTESTACNIRMIKALRRSGLSINDSTGGENPVYLVEFPNEHKPLQLYSKIYDTPENPQSEFAAMMCCSDVDDRCPVVKGSDLRTPLHYRDPKESDDTSAEEQTYDERCLDIAIEMFYIMSKVRPVALSG